MNDNRDGASFFPLQSCAVCARDKRRNVKRSKVRCLKSQNVASFIFMFPILMNQGIVTCLAGLLVCLFLFILVYGL